MRRFSAALLLSLGVAAPAARGASGNDFQPLTPCRVLDTRLPAGPLGGPALQAGVPRAFGLAGVCGIPAGAVAVSVNATVTNTTAASYLVLYAGDIATPGTSNLSFSARQTRASASIVGLAPDGSLKAAVGGGAADLIVDVNGYFAATFAPPPTVTLDPVADQTIPTNTTLSLRLSGHSTDALASLSYRLVSGPTGASVSPLGVFAYSPAQTQIGPKSVTAEVRDGGGRSAQTTFQIAVVDHDHPPVMGPLPDDLTRVGASYTKVLTATDPDAGDVLTFSLLSGPAGMTLTGSTLSWTPAVTQLGNWPVRVKVTDRAGLSASGQFNVGIQFLVATDDAYSVTLGQTLTVNAPGVLGNDLDPLTGPLTAAKLTNPDKGTLSAFGADGSFTYQAPPVLPGPVFAPGVKTYADVPWFFAWSPVVADLDVDGVPEIIVNNLGPSGAGITAWHVKNGTLQVLWDVDGFRFSNGCAGPGQGVFEVAVGDIDDSGHPSIVFPVACLVDNDNPARYMALNGLDGSIKWLSPPLGNARIDKVTLLPLPDNDPAGVPDSLAFGTVPTIARLRSGETPSIVIGRNVSASDFAGKPACNQLVPGWPTNTACRGIFVLDGKDGTVRQRMAARSATPAYDGTTYGNGTQPAVVADLEGHGTSDVVFGGAVFGSDGAVKWNNVTIAEHGLTFWNGLGNFDDTPDVEIVRLDSSGVTFSAWPDRLAVFKPNGRLLWALPLPGSPHTGIPVVADVDGTGRAAVVFNVDANVCAVDNRGNTMWCRDVGTTSGIPNIKDGVRVQVYDLDGDGVPEVVVPLDGEKLLFLDGATGNLKVSLDMAAAIGGAPAVRTSTNLGGPVLTDVDGSGHAAIVTLWSNPARIDVVGAVGNDWRPVRKIFNQASYYPGNVNGNGSVPKTFVNSFATPATNVFGNPAQVLAPVDPRLRSLTKFTYAAADGALTSAPGTVTIDIQPPNRPPKFVSTPPTRWGIPFVPFNYAAQAVDPDVGDAVTYSITLAIGDGAGNCTVNPASGAFNCPQLSSGDYGFVLAATDTQGAKGYQTVSLVRSSGSAGVPNVVGQPEPAAGTILTGAGFAPGAVTRITNAAMAGQVLAQVPAAGASALLGESVALTVSKGPAAPPPPPGPPPGLGNVKRIVVTPASTLHVAGENVPYRAISVNNDGTGADVTAFVTWSSSATAVATVNAAGVAHAVAPGTTLLTATAGGLSGQASLSVVARANADSVLPVAIVTQPASGGTVTGLTQVLGTATDANFVRYELSLQASGDAAFTLIGQGTTPVTNGVLGTLDPTLLLNGAYTLRLTVFDANGNTTTADVPIIADGYQKVGNFTLAYNDLTIPLPGVSVQLMRLYDSRDKRSGDFGVGWSLGVKAVRVSTSGVQGAGWSVVKQGLSYVLAPGSDHFVSVTLPGGKVEKFDLRVTPTVSPLVPFTTLFATFVPRPGTLGTLQSLDNVNLLIADPQPGPVVLLDDSSLAVFHPDRFVYTQMDGTQFVVSRTKGVESVKDTNGNQITISAGGISHSTGAAVTFVRDGSGRVTSITDPKGQTQTYVYTAAGDLASHTDAAAATTAYFYDANHGLVRIVDPLGRPAVRAEYDDAGRLLSVTNGAGATTKYAHDLPGRQEQTEDALGRITLLNYDDRGNVLARTDALGGVTTSTYDAEDNETSRVDPDGLRTDTTYSGILPLTTVVDPMGLHLSTSNVFNTANDPISVTDPAGRVVTATYDASRNITSLTTPFAGTVAVSVDGRGLPLDTTDAVGTKTVLTHDGLGRVTREDVLDAASTLLRRTDSTYDANGNKLSETLWRTVTGVLTPLTTSWTFDVAGRRTSMVDPAGGVTLYEYDALGQQTATVDPLGRRTSFDYDAAGRPILTTFADGTTLAEAYDAAGNLFSRTDQAGRATTLEYDALNRRIRTNHPDGTTTQTLYTPGGRVAATVDGRGDRTDFTYDAAGRLVATLLPPVVNGLGGPPVRPQLASILNAAGSPVTVTDPNGLQTNLQYDGAGRLTRTTFADGSFTTRSYDALGRRIGVTNEEGQSTAFTYDPLGRLLAVHGLAGDVTHTYDEAGNLLTQTDAAGRSTALRYDVLNRLTRRTYPMGETAVLTYDATGNVLSATDPNGKTTSMTYDVMGRLTRKDLPNASAVTYTYSPDGQRASVVDSRGTTIYGYDALGRLASVLHPTGEAVRYVRDANGNVISLTSPAATLAYTYDALDRLLQVSGPEGLGRYYYDLAGNRLRYGAANGTTTDTSYDVRNRPTLVAHRDASSTLLSSFVNVFSPAGRRTQVTELDGSQVQYGYDAKGRLSSETRTGVTPLVIAHAYDAVGNRTQTVENGVTTNFTYDADDRLLGDGTTTYAWDANGNLLSKTVGPLTTLYAWDPENRLASVTDIGGTTQHSYDADGNRVLTAAPSGTTRFLVDGANNTGLPQVLEEKDGGGVLKARYAYGNELVSMGRSGLASFFHFDAQGSTRALTNGAGTPTDSYTFDAYGRTVNATGTTENAYLYGGQRFDAAAGLYQLRARYYAPRTGRFLSRDPFDGLPEAPASLHRYQYASADPVNSSDPTGLLVDEQVAVTGINATIDAAEFTSKFSTACRLKTAVDQFNDIIFMASIPIALVSAHSAISSYLTQMVTPIGKSVFGTSKTKFGGKGQYAFVDIERKGATQGSLKRFAVSATGGGSGRGLKVSIEGAGNREDASRAVDFEIAGPPLSAKVSGGGKSKGLNLKLGNCGINMGEISTELSVKGYGGGSTKVGGLAGAGAELSLKVSLLGKRYTGTLPLIGVDFYTSGTGSGVIVTLAGFGLSY